MQCETYTKAVPRILTRSLLNTMIVFFAVLNSGRFATLSRRSIRDHECYAVRHLIRPRPSTMNPLFNRAVFSTTANGQGFGPSAMPGSVVFVGLLGVVGLLGLLGVVRCDGDCDRLGVWVWILVVEV